MSTDGEQYGTTHDADKDPQLLAQRMVELINGFQTAAAIGAAARLGVPDALASGPQELAAKVGADARSLHRLLNALLGPGLVSESNGSFNLTPLGQMLRSDVPGTARRAVLLWTEEWHWRPYGYLTSTVRSGKPAMRAAHGCDFWEYLSRHEDAAAAFNEVMSSSSAIRAAALVETYDLEEVRCLVDVGGGQGALLKAALGKHPQLRGILFDLPGVVTSAELGLTEAGLADRVEVIGGDFLREVPSGGDLYVLSWILHDWNDEDARTILRNCRAAMSDQARLLVVEMLLPSSADLTSPKGAGIYRLVQSLDLEMMTVIGGRERTAEEYSDLLTAAGFSQPVMSDLGPLWSLLEARPV